MEKFSHAIFFGQIALQNLQRKNLGFSETVLGGSRIRGTDNLKDHTIKLTELLTVLNSEDSLCTLKTDTSDYGIKQGPKILVPRLGFN